FVHDLLSDHEMPRLYASATHYISVSHGEGWDQTMMEAAASGLKLIAPAHSGYLTYLDSSIASLIPSREVPVAYEGDPNTAELFRDASWWEPDMDRAVQLIRDAIDGRGGATASARDRIVQDFTWAQAASRMLTILDEVVSLRDKVRSFKLPRRTGE